MAKAWPAELAAQVTGLLPAFAALIGALVSTGHEHLAHLGRGRIAAHVLALPVTFDPFEAGRADPVMEPMDAFLLPLGRIAGVVRPGPKIQVFAHRP